MSHVRTTLDLDDDVLEVAKELARQQRGTAGQVISDLVRRALDPGTSPRMRNGVPLFTPRPGARKPNRALVNRLRDSE